ncbi:right-handed parallel beta-helix repeat-containing protein [Pseudomonadota bacterium]
MKTKHLFIHVITLFTLCFGPAGFAIDEFPCGETITGKVSLTQNIECSGDPGVTVDGGILDLNGFVLSCTSDANDGVLLTGVGAMLYNGTIAAECDNGVKAVGKGRCQITNVLSTGHNDDGFDIEADGCKLTGNVALDNDDDGFIITGSRTMLTENLSRDNGYWGFSSAPQTDKNKFQSNIAAGNSYDGFEIWGTRHRLLHNFSVENGGDGYIIYGNQHTLMQNRAFLNFWDGIHNLSTNSLFRKNVSSANNTAAAGDTHDTYEFTPGCGSNRWINNAFGSSNDGCIQ